ncbi:MAG: replicative DNA helicase [Lawsonibacter sp.]|jgi:replicative DNA helicase
MSQTDNQYYMAQRSVIGSLILDAPHVAGIVMHRTRPEDYTGECRTIFEACRELFQAGKPIDATTVRARVGKEYTSLLVQLMEETPTAANVETYIDLALEQAKLAKLQGLALAMAGCVTLENAQKLVAQANRIVGDRPGVKIVNVEQGLLDFYERQRMSANLVPWGLERVDGTLRCEYGDFVVLGGYPSAGKTALSLQLAWAQAKDKRVGYFSLETKPEKIIDRTVTAVCGVDFDRIKAHKLNDVDWREIEYRSTAMVGRKLEIIQAGGLSVVDIQALSLAGRYDIIYIDYLQLVAAEDRRRSDFEQVTQISKDLHTMAQTTGITVCALSQLSRPQKGGEQEKAPGLHSLRQSGQIEQDADGVMLLYKEEPKNPRSRRCLKIAKNKDGEAGGIAYLVFDGAHQRFQESVVDAPIPVKRREPEYKQAALYELPGSEKMPWEEDGHGNQQEKDSNSISGRISTVQSNGHPISHAANTLPGNGSGTGDCSGHDYKVPF